MRIWWVVGYGLLLIILAILAIFFRNSFVIKSKFGTFGPPVLIRCDAGCEETGIGVAERECQPNPETGFGCLLSDGSQTFRSQISLVPCRTSCPGSFWEYNFTGPCLYFNTTNEPIPSNVCITSSDNIGSYREIIRTCVSSSNINGPNLCVLRSGFLASPGQSERYLEPCFDALNNICGQYQVCTGQLPYFYRPYFEVLTAESFPYNLFYEGVIVEAQNCTYYSSTGQQITVSTTPNGIKNPNCQLFAGSCRFLPAPIEVPTKKISNPQVQNLCTANASCLGVARVFPGARDAIRTVDVRELYNRPFILTYENSVLQVNDNLTFSLIATDSPLTTGAIFWASPKSNEKSFLLVALKNADVMGWVTFDGISHLSPFANAYLNDLQTQPEVGSTYIDAFPYTIFFYEYIPVPSLFPEGTIGKRVSISLLYSNYVYNMYILPEISSTEFSTVSYITDRS
jgi:hypothetical protein